MKLVKINPNHMSFYSRHFIKGFECGAKRQLEADKRSIPKGHWIGVEKLEDRPSYKWYRCSKCRMLVESRVNYCPDCGADMRGEDND